YGVGCLAATLGNGNLDLSDFVPHIGQTALPDTHIAPSGYQGPVPVQPVPEPPPPPAPKPGAKGAVDPQAPPGVSPPLTPLPAQPLPPGGLSLSNLLKMTANPPPPVPTQPLP